MVGSLILLMVAGIFSAIFGLLSGLWVLPQIATAPTVEIMPKLVGAYLALMLGLLLAAVAGGLASLLTLLGAFRLEWMATVARSSDHVERSGGQGPVATRWPTSAVGAPQSGADNRYDPARRREL